MIEKLVGLEQRFDQIEEKLGSPDIMNDIDGYKKLMKDRKELLPIIEKYKEYKKASANYEEATALSKSDDKELAELAFDEIESSKADMERIEEELKILLLPKDANDDRNVIVEIRAGIGGEEAALFASELYRMYSMYAEAKGFKCDIINVNETELGGFKEMSFTVEGAGAYSRFKYESGTHRVQRVPDTESGGRIHTSAATVAVLPEAEELELVINPADLQIDTFRSSGAGGQKVNKTDSAIRVTHIPTGTVVECQDERSQHKNRDKALRVLRSKLFERMQAEADAKTASERKNMVGTGDRSGKIRTYNFPQNRLTDHRIGLTVYHLDTVMNGDLDEIIEGLSAAERVEKLKEAN